MTELEIVGGPHCGDEFVIEDEEVKDGDQIQLDAETDTWYEVREGKLQIVK